MSRIVIFTTHGWRAGRRSLAAGTPTIYSGLADVVSPVAPSGVASMAVDPGAKKSG